MKTFMKRALFVVMAYLIFDLIRVYVMGGSSSAQEHEFWRFVGVLIGGGIQALLFFYMPYRIAKRLYMKAAGKATASVASTPQPDLQSDTNRPSALAPTSSLELYRTLVAVVGIAFLGTLLVPLACLLGSFH